MVQWWVSVPAWGERYLQVFEEATWPALAQALSNLGCLTTLVIHTDEPHRVREVVARSGLVVNLLMPAVPGEDRAFDSLSQAHRGVLSLADPSDRVCLLTADMVVSSEVLVRCEEQFATGVRLVCCMGMRGCDTELPAAGLPGRDLLAWGWARRHPMTRESTWPEGHSYDVWRMYFEKDGEAACRLCLPHPLALIRGRGEIKFFPTVDVNVASNFGTRDIHLITDPVEGAVIELSPPDKEFLLTETMQHRYESRGPSIPPFNQLANPRHKYFFDKRITIVGSGGDCGDVQVVDRLMHGR